MTDPFHTLFGPDEPVTPRAAFAEQLRSTVAGELAELLGDRSVPGPDHVNHGSLFYFTLPGADVERSARFYRSLFGWNLNRGRSGYHVADVYPPMGLASNDAAEPQVWVEVADLEAAIETVRAAGGTATDPIEDDSGRSSRCVDPQGVHFQLIVPIREYRQAARRSNEPGELFYWSLPAPKASSSKEFYGLLFGWEFGTPGDQGGMHVENRLPDGGLGGGRQAAHPQIFFRVEDLDRAMARVRELGGTAEPAGEGDEGRHAMCRDDQGVEFGLSEPAAMS